MSFTTFDHQIMQHALTLAEKGRFTTPPNPNVGCVITQNNDIIGEGYHHRAGEAHAEVNALRMAGIRAKGATAYVTLEPCNHTGRTGPCTEALIQAGVKKVIAAMQDPNPLVAGQGLDRLRAAGIEVQTGLMEYEARELNLGFISRMQRNRPWIRIKVAASLDGKTALANGESKWITSSDSRHDVQRLRAESGAIMTGIGTVLADDPALTVRDFDIGREPLRVVLDSQLRISSEAKVFDSPAALIVTLNPDPIKMAAIMAKGGEVVVQKGSKIDLDAVLHLLAERGCNDVLLEAGMTLTGAMLPLADEFILYQAPVLLGDAGRGIADFQIQTLQDKVSPLASDLVRVGPDARWILRLKNL